MPARTPLVITHSSGNHGNALALAARARGMQAIVVIPRDSARSKIAAIEAAGARIELCDPGLPAREKRLAEILAREPAELVHPFDDERIIAGQGTAALELLAEVPALDVISTPVGGGGLIGGTALAAKALAPGIRVIGAEPEQADDACQSFRSGERCAVIAPKTIADGSARLDRRAQLRAAAPPRRRCGHRQRGGDRGGHARGARRPQAAHRAVVGGAGGGGPGGQAR